MELETRYAGGVGRCIVHLDLEPIAGSRIHSDERAGYVEERKSGGARYRSSR
jgi:hypothetical protein